MSEEYLSSAKRKAIVLGAGGALGRAVASKFASEDMPLVLAGRTLNKLQETKDYLLERLDSPADIDTQQVDLTNIESIESFVEIVNRQPESPSVLVNTAAGFFKGAFEEINSKQLSELIDSNFKGVMILLQQLMPTLIRNAPSDVVNVTSISSATTMDTSRSSTPHIVTKASLQILDIVLGREAASKGVRVTTVAPDTLAKGEREGISLETLANLIFQVISLPSTVRIESVVLHATKWRK
jgi:3-oxoacyl-[acyl-carrier protein] reductase